jgi:hypothetical protein
MHQQECLKTHNPTNLHDSPLQVATNPIVYVKPIHLNRITVFLNQIHEEQY